MGRCMSQDYLFKVTCYHSGTCFPIITPTRLNRTSLSVLPATASFQIIKVFGCLFMFIGWTHSNDHWIITELFGSCTRHLVVGTLFWIVDILIGVNAYHCEINVEYSRVHIIKCKSVPYFSKNYIASALFQSISVCCAYLEMPMLIARVSCQYLTKLHK